MVSAALSAAVMAGTLTLPGLALAAPAGGQVTSGAAQISQTGATTNISQSSQNVSINWQSFNVGAQETVNFAQPSSSSIAVNRIADANASAIYGKLNANGQVYLINPNGVLFGAGSQVNVGGLVASTLDVSDSALSNAQRTFSGSGTGSVVNQGTITAADGGYVALLGNSVSNQGVIAARLGTVALAGARSATLSFAGNSLLSVTVDQSTLNTLAENKQLIQADGGTVLMTAGAKDTLLASVVNNTGVVEARTVENKNGTITLLAGMKAGTTEAGGTLDASAPNGGNGGFIETSGAKVHVADDFKVTTQAASGQTGTWLVDPTDFTVAASGGDITGAQVGTALGTSNVTYTNSLGASGTVGNINVNDAISWSSPNALTLTADANVNINAAITATALGAAFNATALAGAINVNAGGNVNMAGAAGSAVTLQSATGLNVASGGKIDLAPTSALTINGNAYTLISTLGAATDTGGTTLQGLQNMTSGYYALATDIDAIASSGFNAGAGFTPIATTATPFNGTFEGLGHTISNLTINRPATPDQGLFGGLGPTGLIENVNVSGTIAGGNGTGMLLGDNVGGTVRYISTSGIITSTGSGIGGAVGSNQGAGFITNSSSSVNVTGSTDVGGFVGLNEDTAQITNSSASGTVGGTSSVGGFVGTNSTATAGQTSTGITNSTASGNVSGTSNLGGFAGQQVNGYLNNVSASGTVTGTGSAIGGVLGYNVVGSTITNAASSSTVNALNALAVGGVIGQNSGQASVLRHTAGTVSGNFDVGGVVGLNQGGHLSQAYNTGNVVGNGLSQFIGGVVGENASGGIGGTVDQTFNTGAVSGGLFVGGVAGGNTNGTAVSAPNLPTISNSYSTGSVTASIYAAGGVVGLGDAGSPSVLTNVYASGAVTGPTSGGIYGENGAPTINTGAYYLPGTGAISGVGSGSLTGITGLNSTQALQQASYTGFDFTSGTPVWKIYEGTTAPLLNYLLTPLTITAPTTASTITYDGIDHAVSSGLGATYSIAGFDAAAAVAAGRLSNTAYTGASAKNVGTYTTAASVTSTQLGTDPNVGGYNVTYVGGGSLTIDPAPVTAALTGSITKVYDKTTDATLTSGNYVLTGVASGESITVSQTAGTYNSATVAGANTVTAALSSGDFSAGGGTLLSNYTLPTTASGPGTITPLTITAAVASSSKVYDGLLSTNATLSGTGVISGDTVTVAGTAALTDKNVGTGKTVNVSGISLSGADAGNYQLASTTATATNAAVTPKTLTAAATASNKVYDGNTTATTVLGSTDIVAGDTVTLTGSSSNFSDKNVGTAKTVTVAGIAAGGTDAGNYTLASTSATTTADITPKTLTVTAGAADKVYDGTTAAATTAATAGIVAGDSVTVSGAGNFADKNVGTGKTVTYSGLALSGSDAGNYALPSSSVTTTASITPAPLQYVATPATVAAGTTPTGLAGTVTGFVTGDTLANSTTGTLVWTTPATSSSPAGSYAIDGSGLAAQNYTLSQAPGNASALTISSTVTPPPGGTLTPAQAALAGRQVASALLLQSPWASSLREPGTEDVHSGIPRVSPAKFDRLDYVDVRPDERRNTLRQVAVNGGMRLPADRLIPPGGESADRSDSNPAR